LIVSNSKRTREAKEKLINVSSWLRKVHPFLVFLSTNKMRRKEKNSCGMIPMKKLCLFLNEICLKSFSFKNKPHNINTKSVFAVFTVTNMAFTIGQLKGKDRYRKILLTFLMMNRYINKVAIPRSLFQFNFWADQQKNTPQWLVGWISKTIS
jgi:hypothetical protein